MYQISKEEENRIIETAQTITRMLSGKSRLGPAVATVEIPLDLLKKIIKLMEEEIEVSDTLSAGDIQDLTHFLSFLEDAKYNAEMVF